MYVCMCLSIYLMDSFQLRVTVVILLTLGAHAPEGYRSYLVVCVSVCLSVCYRSSCFNVRLYPGFS